MQKEKNLESVACAKGKVFGHAFLKESLTKNFVQNFVLLLCTEVEQLLQMNENRTPSVKNLESVLSARGKVFGQAFFKKLAGA